MPQPTTFRSQLTAAEIEQRLIDVPGKFGVGDLVTDDQTNDETKPIAASVIFALKNFVDSKTTVEAIKQAIADAPDCNIFTDALKAKLEDLNAQFKGSYSDLATRDVALPSEVTNTFIGGELILVIDNGSGDSEFQRWDNGNTVWVTVNLSHAGVGVTESTPAVGSDVAIVTFAHADYDVALYQIVAKNGTNDIHSAIVQIAHENGDTFLSHFSKIAPTTDIFTIASSIVGDDVNLIVNAIETCDVVVKELSVI